MSLGDRTDWLNGSIEKKPSPASCLIPFGPVKTPQNQLGLPTLAWPGYADRYRTQSPLIAMIQNSPGLPVPDTLLALIPGNMTDPTVSFLAPSPLHLSASLMLSV